MTHIGSYSLVKLRDGDIAYNVKIPKKYLHGRKYPYLCKFLTDDIEDIESTIKSDIGTNEKIILYEGDVYSI